MDDFDWRVAVASWVLTSLVLSLFTPDAYAVVPNFDALTSAVDYDPVIAAVLVVCSGLAGIYIVMSGASMILQKLRDPDYDADFAEWDSRR